MQSHLLCLEAWWVLGGLFGFYYLGLGFGGLLLLVLVLVLVLGLMCFGCVFSLGFFFKVFPLLVPFPFQNLLKI